MALTLLWNVELRITAAEGRQTAAAAHRLREMADAIDRLPPNLMVGMGDLPMGRVVDVAGAAPDGTGWRGTWSVRQERDELPPAARELLAAVAP